MNYDFEEELKSLSDQERFDDIILMLTDNLLEKQRDQNLYLRRGVAWYNKREYNNAIADFTIAIDLSPRSELAYYNRGLAWNANMEYDNAISDYNMVLNLNPNYTDAYINRGNIMRSVFKKYDKAITDYNKAINVKPDNGNAYYYRGLAYYTKGVKEKRYDGILEKGKQDFEKYLELTTEKNDLGTKYAKWYIKKLDQLRDKDFSAIIELIYRIKEVLLINEECITHYTSLSTLKNLILDITKFRISEGNFLNDKSEGEVFFKYLQYEPYSTSGDGIYSVTFSPKPFIGSFVTSDKCDDLIMWRLYGKEKGEDGKGCAITLRMQNFIENIKNNLSNEKIKEARLDDENDITFYQVAYVSHDEPTIFHISNSEKKIELGKLMVDLKEKVNSYKGDNINSLYEELNNIAFLFKSGNYIEEREVRLVIKGIEFEKKYNLDLSSPRVYIELVPISDIVSQITFGPKVDKKIEWESAFYYRYKNDLPKIMFSKLPYR